MRKAFALLGVLLVISPVWAQEKEKTTITTKTETIKEGGADVLGELWSFQDATPVAPGQLDLRLTGQWITAGAPANRGDSNDDFVVTPSLVWGSCPNVEVFARVPAWVGDAGDIPGQDSGNFDTYLGFLWRFAEQQDNWPAMAFQGTARIPTGDNSSGVDGEFRIILTNEYASGIRSHFNAFATTVNGHNDESDNRYETSFNGRPQYSDDTRDFQYGGVIGLDGPLCDNGAVRWVFDYMNRSSYHDGASNINLLDVGWEWATSDASHLGMSMQVGLDDNEDTPNFGAKVTYAWSITY